MAESDSSILQGTLDLMVLRTLEQLGPLHGYGIARRIEQVGKSALIVNQGTVYLCLVRLLQEKWIKAVSQAVGAFLSLIVARVRGFFRSREAPSVARETARHLRMPMLAERRRIV